MKRLTDPTDAASPNDRQKAYRLREKIRRGGTLEPEEASWYAAYDAQHPAMGASASSRTVHVEEKHMAMGTGPAAEAAAAASLAREEGRRIDYLARVGMDELLKACHLHREMAATLLARTQVLEETHISMLTAIRDHFISRTEAEADLMRLQVEHATESGEDATANQLLVHMLTGGGGLRIPRRGPPPPRRPPPRRPARPAPPPPARQRAAG